MTNNQMLTANNRKLQTINQMGTGDCNYQLLIINDRIEVLIYLI